MTVVIHSFDVFELLILPFDYDLYLETDYEGRLKTKLYDKRDDFSFQIVWIFTFKPRVPNGEVEIITL